MASQAIIRGFESRCPLHFFFAVFLLLDVYMRANNKHLICKKAPVSAARMLSNNLTT